MTELLERAFAEAGRLPETEQNSLAQWLLSELESEKAWQKKFAASGDLLRKMAQEAIEEDRQGMTQELDPDRL
ncbi:MAG TPA: hypothetical protein VGH73_09015 [Thermoanaerobaculia bacterium]